MRYEVQMKARSIDDFPTPALILDRATRRHDLERRSNRLCKSVVDVRSVEG